MAQILLISSNEVERTKLAAALRHRGHIVCLADHCGTADFRSGIGPQRIEIVVCDVAVLNEAGWRELRALAELLRHDPAGIRMLCYCRIYRGPRFQLDVERLGARFVYAE